MKYPSIITALLLPLAAYAAPQQTPAGPRVEHIQGQAEVDPAFLEKLKADGGALDEQPGRVEAHAIPVQPNWSAPKPADLKALQEFLTAAAAKKEPWLKESYSVTMKAAAFLATGKPGAPAPGRQQVMNLNLMGPESISAVVTFNGYDDEKLPGERFELSLRVKADGTWSITKATRSTLSIAVGTPEA